MYPTFQYIMDTYKIKKMSALAGNTLYSDYNNVILNIYIRLSEIKFLINMLYIY